MASVFYNILDLAGINARILFKEQQQQESPEESYDSVMRFVFSELVGSLYSVCRLAAAQHLAISSAFTSG